MGSRPAFVSDLSLTQVHWIQHIISALSQHHVISNQVANYVTSFSSLQVLASNLVPKVDIVLLQFENLFTACRNLSYPRISLPEPDSRTLPLFALSGL